MPIAKFISGMLLILCLSLFALSAAMYSFAKVETLEETLPQLIETQSGGFTQAQATQFKNDITSKCNSTGYPTADIPVSESLVINLDCNEVKNTPDEKIMPLILASMVNTIYYAKYDCGFINCLAIGQPFVLLSEKADDIYRISSYIFIALSVVFAVLLFGLSRSITDGLSSEGKAFAVTGCTAIPLFIIKYALKSPLKIINFLLNSLQFKFEILLIVGIILIVIAALVKRFKK